MKTKKRDEEILKMKSRKISIAEGSAFSVMESFGLRYITPYAIAIGMSNFFIGILSSLPSLLGSFSQLQSSKLVEKGSRKKIVLVGVVLQTLSWLPILAVGYAYFFLGLNSINASLLLIFFYTLLIIFGASLEPAWNSWMRDLVDKDTDYYFARRSFISGVVGLVCLFIAGILLSYFGRRGTFYGFLAIFLIAFLGRGLSSYLFTKQYEPKPKNSEKYHFTFLQFLERARYTNFGMFVIFSTLISFAVAIASPFFPVYMLQELGLNYLSYTFLIIIPIATTLAFLPFWGKIGDKYGNIKVLKICGAFIFVVPLLWLISHFVLSLFGSVILYLTIVEIFSGIVWSGFSLSTATFIFYAVSKEKLPLCVAYSTILNSLGAFVGAIIGGVISSYNFAVLGLSPILTVFLISSVLRFALYFTFVKKIKEVRPVPDFTIGDLRDSIFKVWPNSMIETTGIKRIGHIHFR